MSKPILARVVVTTVLLALLLLAALFAISAFRIVAAFALGWMVGDIGRWAGNQVAPKSQRHEVDW